MGSENGDSINGDPLMDINVDVEMDKEPSSSSVPLIEKKSIEAQPEPNIEVISTENKTEQGTSEQHDEVVNEDAKVSTNGHHNEELDDTIGNDDDITEDPKVNDEPTVESSDKTDNASTGVETNTVEKQPAEPDEKVNSPEVSADVSQPILEASQATSDTDKPNESDANKKSEEKESPEKEAAEINEELILKEDANEITVEKTPPAISESVKHLLDNDGDEEEFQPTAAKLVKLEESVTSAETVVLSVSEKVDANISEEPEPTKSEPQPASEEKEILPEPVLLEKSAAVPTGQVEKEPIVDAVVDEPAVVAEVKEKVVDKQLEVVASATIPTDPAPGQPDTIDETNNDTTSSDNTISPLASTISNDLDTLEEDEDELVDAEQIISESSTHAETDVEMLPSIENPEQMAVEDPTPVLPTSNSDLAMDATQIIPPSTDEQMDVFDNNSMDQDL